MTLPLERAGSCKMLPSSVLLIWVLLPCLKDQYESLLLEKPSLSTPWLRSGASALDFVSQLKFILYCCLFMFPLSPIPPTYTYYKASDSKDYFILLL